MWWIASLLGCAGGDAIDTGDVCATPAAEVTEYQVLYSTDPETPSAGEEATFTTQILDQRDCPIQDLQQAHERMIHTILISRDLTSFQHLHTEDFGELTAENLKEATYSFPVTFPMAGDYRIVTDYAHANAYKWADGWLTVDGSPPMGVTPVVEEVTEREVDGLVVSFAWDVEPYAGYEAQFTITVRDADGNDVTDLVQWLGADAHAAVATEDLSYVSHTHAWYPDMENAAPGHPMPHLYDGPTLPFHYTFPTAGTWKMWVQFARADAPDDPYVADFGFEVAP